MQKLEYTIVDGEYLTSLRDFSDKVNELIIKGWEPFGGVSSIGTASRAWPIQAMVKERCL